MLTQDRLKELLFFNQLTGVFTWRDTKANILAGSIAGYKNPDGYVLVGVDGTQYLAHRLVILYVKGYFPEGLVDHKDQIPWHNWCSNLRETTDMCNGRNRGNPKNNTSGIKGVSWSKRDGKCKAYIQVAGKRFNLGSFTDFDEAVANRLAAEQAENWAGCDSNSPAYNYMRVV